MTSCPCTCRASIVCLGAWAEAGLGGQIPVCAISRGQQQHNPKQKKHTIIPNDPKPGFLPSEVDAFPQHGDTLCEHVRNEARLSMFRREQRTHGIVVIPRAHGHDTLPECLEVLEAAGHRSRASTRAISSRASPRLFWAPNSLGHFFRLQIPPVHFCTHPPLVPEAVQFHAGIHR